ncbi:polymorphic toxin-type HINT domain-containing protein [Tuwongella immobilis]|uniref:Intein C-terminal splicing domain-containing protein n=1 Tax=Tuwongella immobilis TaxID=692036 RepID=A0A6C2YIJ6_9BACT
MGSGQLIETTAEHPFWVVGRGWTPVWELSIGDCLTTITGETVSVEGIHETNRRETVYNLRVSDFHTYFVGCDEWGFSVWAHNNNACVLKAEIAELQGQRAGMQIGSPQHQAATQRLARLEERLQLETAIKDLPPLRQDYIREVDGLKDTAAAPRAAGKSPEEIARALYQARRDIGIKFKDMTPADELAKIHARNLEKYGDKLGPSIDYLRGKRKSWEDIIESATRSGGADLGLGKK